MARDPDHVLVLAPVGRDAQLTCEILDRAGIAGRACSEAEQFCAGVRDGAGAALLTEEGLGRVWPRPLGDLLAEQEPWSDLPIVALTGGRPASSSQLDLLRTLEARHSLTFLERPVRVMTLVSSVRAALESRRRQYQCRDLFDRLAEGIRERDEFLAFLAHELRNPLGTIRNWVEVLRIGAHAREQVDLAAQTLDRQVRHMTRLVDDLLDLSRISQGRPRVHKVRLDLRKVAERAVEMTRALIDGRGHRLTLDLPERPVWVDGDEVRLVQVVSNLLANASSYTDAGGSIDLRVGDEDGVAAVRVRDNGRGLSAEMLDRVFDMFLRHDRSSSGLGIGLTLARRVALLHGGSLVACSEGEGKGSEFVLRLPLAETGALTSADVRDEDPHARLRVLLVEDQVDQGRALAMVMEHRGHEVRLADTGHKALAEARAFQPDVVLLDLDLPDMDGCEVARRLRASGARAPLVALSGFGLDSDRQRTRAAGCAAHLTKPVTPQQLEQVFRTVRPS